MMRARFIVLLVFLEISSFSCTSHDPSTLKGWEGQDLEMTMFVRDQTGSESLYRVERDGTLSFGGGRDARLGSFSWSGAMSDDEVRELAGLIEGHGWRERTPKTTDRDSEALYRVSIRAPSMRKSFSVKGEHPDVRPVADLLRQVSLRRLEDDLKRLPEPSLRQGGAATAPADQSLHK